MEGLPNPAKHIYIVGGVLAVIAVAAVLAVLWLRGHDAEVRSQVQASIGNADAKVQQQTIEKLAASIQAVNDKAESERKANDAKFDAMKTVMQQAVNMAQTMGMKQPPVIIQPGTNAALPQGGVYLNPDQVQTTHDYEKVCEDCKIENRKLAATVVANDATIVAKDKQLVDKDGEIKKLNNELGHGFRNRLEDCAGRAAIGATSGAVGAAMSQPNPYAPNKPVGKAALVGGSLGALSCLVFHR